MALVSNAIDAMHGTNGVLEVSLSRRRVKPRDVAALPELAAGRDYAKLTVRDTGCGMGEDTLERIFEPSFTTKDRATARGLGLFTVDRVVAAHGGVVNVASEPGRGTAFEIYLPLADQIRSRVPPTNGTARRRR